MEKVEIVYGPPGTGKSKNLIDHVSTFLKARPSNTAMMCSHTKSAALTIKDRWAQGFSNVRLQANTLHSYCFGQLGITRGQVVDDDKVIMFLNDYGLDMEPGGEGVQYMDLINYAGAMAVNPMTIYRADRHPGTRDHFGAVWYSYNDWKKSYGYVDFNDMLILYTQRNVAPDFHMLAIDEAQDLSVLHWNVVNHMLTARRSRISHVLVTGDEDQSLFSYAGVDPLGMQKFAERWVGSEVRVLGQSYRVPEAAYNLAMRIIKRVAGRVEKEYKPVQAPGEVNWIDSLYRLTDYLKPEEDSFIIYSDKFVREKIEMILKESYIPYEAFTGLPAPLQTAGGRALAAAAEDGELTDERRTVIRRGLSNRAVDVWDRIGPHDVIQRLRSRDLDMVKIHWTNEDYLRNVELNAKHSVRISTIHGAKGAEAEVVHLINSVSPAAMDYAQIDTAALHRLFYVGVTRTKNKLYVYEDENPYDF